MIYNKFIRLEESILKIRELLDYLDTFDYDDELEIDIYETISKRYIDTTYDIKIDTEGINPTLVIDVEAGKF
jgi:hypothetical protein